MRRLKQSKQLGEIMAVLRAARYEIEGFAEVDAGLVPPYASSTLAGCVKYVVEQRDLLCDDAEALDRLLAPEQDADGEEPPMVYALMDVLTREYGAAGNATAYAVLHCIAEQIDKAARTA